MSNIPVYTLFIFYRFSLHYKNWCKHVYVIVYVCRATQTFPRESLSYAFIQLGVYFYFE